MSETSLATSLNRFQNLIERNRGLEILLEVVSELALAHNIDEIMDITRRCARKLSQADGASFILRDDQHCFYAEENAIKPFWKGRRFLMSECVWGWAMLNRQVVVIGDVFGDDYRIPVEAYRPTHIKSLVIVPIRKDDPVGAIGVHWAQQHEATPAEVDLLRALADATAAAMENIEVSANLEQHIQERTANLETANKELEAFSSSISHDLRSPLTAILGNAEVHMEGGLIKQPFANLDFLDDIRISALKMRDLIDDLLKLSKVSQTDTSPSTVDLSGMAREILAHLQASDLSRMMSVDVEDGLEVTGDAGLLLIMLENLFSNAWKYTSKNSDPHLEFRKELQEDGSEAFFVRDNGVGFDMSNAQRLFEPFQRLHSSREFPGTGIGLATVHRIIQKLGGRIWADSSPGNGASFYFTLSPGTESPVPPTAT